MKRNQWKREVVRLAACAALAAAASAPGAAHAVDVGACVPPVTGAPWNGNAPNLSDVGNLGGIPWTGSFGYNWNPGATTKGSFQWLVVQPPAGDTTHLGYLYFYWKSTVNEPSVSSDEGIRFGVTVTDPVTSHKIAQVYTINVQGTNVVPQTLTQPVPSLPSSVEVDSRDGLNDPVQVGSPGWMQNDNTYVTSWLIPSGDATNPYNWAITARIPIKKQLVNGSGTALTLLDSSGKLVDTANAGLFIDPGVLNPASTLSTAPATSFWSDMFWAPPVDNPGNAQQPVVHYPDSIDVSVLPTNANLPPVPALSAWNTAQLVAPSDALCSTPGLYITANDIFTSTGSWAGDLSAFTGNDPSAVQSLNTGYVTVHNKGSAITATDAAKIHATFSIAQEGSQALTTTGSVGTQLWAPLNTLGNKLTYSCSGTTCAPKNVAAPAIPSAYVAGTLTGTSLDQTFNVQMSTPWKPDFSYICATYFTDQVNPSTGATYPAGFGYSILPTQCASAPWKPTAWPNDGIGSHQCMLVNLTADDDRQFNQASAFHNMHLGHASLFNDWGTISSGGLPPIAGQAGRYLYLQVETRNLPKVIASGQNPTSVTKSNTMVVEKNGLVFNATRGDQYTYDQVAEFLPTFIVHVYHDTGRKRTTKSGHTFNVIEEQTSYGDFIQHNGALYGWRQLLTGADRIGPNFYRVYIPNNGKVIVGTTIEARETACSGTAFPKVTTLLQQIQAYLVLVKSPLAGELAPIVAASKVQCVDLYDFVQELKAQPSLSTLGPLLNAVLTASGCSCS